MNVYEINQQIEDFVKANTDEETGELLNFDEFLNLQMERNAKIENTALYYKNLVSDAKALKGEIDTLLARKSG